MEVKTTADVEGEATESESAAESGGGSGGGGVPRLYLTCNTENVTHLPFETTQEIKVCQHPPLTAFHLLSLSN